MSLVSDVITDIRVEVNDSASSRFTDATILALVKQAIRRANRICQRNSLHFAKKKGALSTVASQAYVSMPVDLDIPIGIWRDDTHAKVTQRTEAEWEQIISASNLANWFLDLENSRIYFNGTPTTVYALTMWYYPTVDPSAYTTASTMPWGGKLDDIIGRYVALRLQNIDEMNTTMDMQILQDLENQILSAYQPQSPTIITSDGWL